MGFGKKKKVGVEDADSQKSTSDYVLQLPRPLNVDEKKYLLAVERGDLANVTRMLQIAQKDGNMVIKMFHLNSNTKFILRLNYRPITVVFRIS